MSSLQSPPVSQGDEDMVMFDSPTSNSNAGKSGEPTTEQAFVGNEASGSSSTARNNNASPTHGAPGSTWQTKKFQEDYDRSMSQILDQKWSMASYPDPLLKK